MARIQQDLIDESKSEGRRCHRRLLPSLFIFLFSLLSMPASEARAGHGFAIGAGALAGPVLSTSVAAGLGLTSSTGVVIAFIVSVSKDDSARLQRYFEENQHDVEASLALGGGEVVDDLAQMFGVPSSGRAGFAQIMASERDRVLAMYQDGEVTLEEASEVGEAILEGMLDDPELCASLLERIEWTSSREVYAEYLLQSSNLAYEVRVSDVRRTTAR